MTTGIRTHSGVRVAALAFLLALPLAGTPALAATTAPAVDADLNGDNLPDLVAAGGAHGLASGLWLAAGAGDGTLASAVDVGSHGNGVFSPGQTGSPADFDGAQVVTGRFTGRSVQDVLVYYPQGRNAGGAVILHGNGDGSPFLTETDGSYSNINAGTFSGTDYSDWQQIHSPSQLVNAGHHASAYYPDLVGVAGKDDGSSFLTYYPNYSGGYADLVPLTVPTPTGGSDWSSWTLASAQTAGGTALFLRQAGSGALYLWNDFVPAGDGTATFTSYLLSGSFHTGEDVTLYAGDIDSDGTGDLWTVSDGAEATAWLVTDLDSAASTGVVTARPAQQLPTA
ncbi:hypothetical protein [Actinoplanes sp. L3-i22]|uniref:hypothetical protein n=1 Tax=Actinoplanes sp. L3-i22 TaxID=2836373 RepID=UPI001C863037|nr:hypothetical protein [Actinoplanes sp. L3-i22]